MDKFKSETQEVGRKKIGEIKEEIGEDDGRAKTQTNFRIKSAKNIDHKDILKQIFDEFKKKEDKKKQMDEKMFALEEADKRIKKGKESDNSNEKILEEGWQGNGLGKRKIEESKLKKEDPTAVTRNLAAHFLANIEKKIQKVPANKE
jgi:hypothetical protein